MVGHRRQAMLQLSNFLSSLFFELAWSASTMPVSYVARSIQREFINLCVKKDRGFDKIKQSLIQTELMREI